MPVSREKSNKVFFDLETNGFGGSGSIYNCFHRIIQISARIHDKSFVTYVNPGVHIPSLSTKIHHITDDDVKDKPTFYYAFASFLQFIYQNTDHGEHTILIAHNAFGFDVPMLQKECNRVGVSIPPEFYVYDTLRVYRREFPLKESKKLGNLYNEFFGKEMENAHDALADSIGLQELFLAELYEKFDPSDISTLTNYYVFENDEPIENICGIGSVTAWKISKHTKTSPVFMRDLRRIMCGRGDHEIESFIRKELNQHQEAYVFSIWYAITSGHGRPPSYFFQPSTGTTRFPFCDNAFQEYWGPKISQAFKLLDIRSVEMLRRQYYYVMREDDEELKKLAKTAGSEFHKVKLLVTI